MQLRFLNNSDFTDFVALQAEAFAPGWQEQQWQRALANKHQLLLGLDHQGVLVGFAVFSYVLDEAELLQLAISAKHQRRGMATILLQQAWPLLSDVGISRVMLEVRQSNQAARNLYQRLGFVEDGRRKDYYPTAAGREDEIGRASCRERVCMFV